MRSAGEGVFAFEFEPRPDKPGVSMGLGVEEDVEGVLRRGEDVLVSPVLCRSPPRRLRRSPAPR